MASMNFLQLVQRFRQETNYANTGPSAVTGQTGDHARAVDWVSTAYEELQDEQDWRWLRKTFSLTTTASDDKYAYTDATDVDAGGAISRFKAWAIDDPYNPPTCYLQSSGEGTEYPLTFLEWEHFRYIYELGSQADSAPSFISIDPQDNLRLGPAPDAVYIVQGEFDKGPQVLAADSDTPEMPSQYHMLVVYKAMEDRGFFHSAPEILGRSERKGLRLKRQLMNTQGPIPRMSGPLA